MYRIHSAPAAVMIRDVWKRGGNLDNEMAKRIASCDVLTYRTIGRRFVVVAHPDLIDFVVLEGREHYEKSIEFENLRAAFGTALITDDGASWESHRGIVQPMFAKRRLNGLVDLMVEPITDLADTIETGMDPPTRTTLDVSQAMVDLTLDVVGNTLFGRGFSQINEQIAAHVTDGMRYGDSLARLLLVFGPPRWTVRALIKLVRSRVPLVGALAGMRRVLRATDDYINEVVDGRLAEPVDSPDLLSLLLEATHAEEPITLERARGEALQFMLAGHETTANAMNWFWYLLAVNPDARQKMFDEIDQVLQGRAPALDDLSHLPWTTACIEEAMRFYPPVPTVPRVAIDDHEMHGIPIRRGTTVLIPVHSVHHDPDLWDEPELFDPSRFLPGAEVHPRSAYLPFGSGRRICIGRSFALMEMVLIAAAFGQRFVFDLVPGHPVVTEAAMTLRPRYGLPMVATLRTKVSA